MRKKKLSSKPLVAVDSDTLLFKAAAICDNRSIEVTHTPTGISKSFQNRTEFYDLMKSKSKEVTDAYVIADVQDPSPVSHALHIIKNQIETILDNFSDCEVIFCAGDSENFRAKLPYPTKYKGNRDDMIRPVLLKDTHDYISKSYKSVRATGHECDDEVSCLAYEALKQGRKAYILSPDGDSRQFDGVYLGTYDSTPSSCELLDFFPGITWNEEKKLCHSSGLPWMCMQATTGDPTDGLKPTYLCKKRYGEKSYYNDVHTFTKPEQYIQYVISKYREWYPSEFEYTSFDGRTIKADWKFMLELYWKGTTMKRDRNKEPDIWEFLKEKEIEVTV